MADRASTDFVRRDREYLNATNVLDFVNQEYTCACWARADSTTGSYSGIMTQSDVSQLMMIARHNTKFAFWGTAWYDGTTTISTGTWYFLAATYENTGHVRKLYVGTTISNLAEEVSQVKNIFSVGPNQLGLAYYRPGDVAGWDGGMAHAMAFDYVMGLDELKELMANPYSITNGKLVHYPMFSSDPGIDVSINGNNASTTGTPVASDSGPPIVLYEAQ
jgi:hypothetical protein